MIDESKKNQVAIREENHLEFSPEKMQLLKDTLCKGITNDELELFKHACTRTGLDPFMRQIYPVKRWDSALKREAMALQVGIDGYRLIADRTGRYAPGRESTYIYDNNGNLISATAYVKKQTRDGTWHEIPGTAFYSEYVGLTKDGSPTTMWRTKKHIMTAKCAEALALRKAFPAELSGIYTAEEMDQASNPTPGAPIKDEKISKDQVERLLQILETCPPDYKSVVMNHISKACGRMEELKTNAYNAIMSRIDEKLGILNTISVEVEEVSDETSTA